MERHASRRGRAACGRPPPADGHGAGAGVVARRAPADRFHCGRLHRCQRSRAAVRDGGARNGARAARRIAGPAHRWGRRGSRRGRDRRDFAEHLGERRARHVRNDHGVDRRRRDVARGVVAQGADAHTRGRARCAVRTGRARARRTDLADSVARRPDCVSPPEPLAARAHRVARERDRHHAVGGVQREPVPSTDVHLHERRHRIGRVELPCRLLRRGHRPDLVPEGLPRRSAAAGRPERCGQGVSEARVPLHADARRPRGRRRVRARRAHMEPVPPARHGVVQQARGPRVVGHAPRPAAVLPDAAVRDRRRGAAVAVARTSLALDPDHPGDCGDDRLSRHLRADPLPRRCRALARPPRGGRHRRARRSHPASPCGRRAGAG